MSRPGRAGLAEGAEAGSVSNPSRASSNASSLPTLAGLCALWAVLAWVVDPVADVPLVDDWAYGLPVFFLVEEGELRFTDWQSMPLLTQVMWGALFSLAGGASFTSLRLSTLVGAALASVALHVLLRRFGASPAMALLGALTLIANPVFFCLSYTFMTDVPFLCLALWSVVCVVRGLETGRRRDLAMGFVLAGLATLLRQLGLAIPLAFAAVVVLREGPTPHAWRRALLPVVAIGALLLAYERAVDWHMGLPALYPERSATLLDAASDLVHLRLGVLRYPASRTLQLLVYCGLFSLPFLAAWLPLARRGGALPAARRTLLGVVTTSLVVTVGLALTGHALPSFGNVLVDFGVGVRTLAGGSPPGLPRPGWLILSWIGAAGGILLALTAARGLALGVRGRAASPEAARLAFVLALLVVYFTPLALAYGPAFDRYFLLPGALLLVVAQAALPPRAAARPATLIASFALSAVFLAFSSAATHDYLSWNRARWQAAAFLEDRLRVDSSEIDGGFEYNNFVPRWSGPRTRSHPVRIERPGSAYAIVLAPAEGDEVIESVPCRAWLPFGVQRVYAVRRAEPAT